MSDLINLRENYDLGKLLEENLHDDPISQFNLWMGDAIQSKEKEPNAMVLSTINSAGAPSSRVVLVKEVDPDGILFYTNYDSDKACQIDMNPVVSLNFNWLCLQRQIRIEGWVEKVSEERATKYFQGRPKSSQIGAWVSEQSKVIPNRQILEEKKKELEDKYEDAKVLPKPTNWGGYKIIPHMLEFWQGRRSRLHDRLRYRKIEAGGWIVERVSP